MVEEIFGWIYNYCLGLKYPDIGRMQTGEATLGRVGEFRSVALIKYPDCGCCCVCVLAMLAMRKNTSCISAMHVLKYHKCCRVRVVVELGEEQQ